MRALLALAFLSSSVFGRIPPEARKFRSEAIDNLIDTLKPKFRDRELASLFENTLPNTLDTAVEYFSPLDPVSGQPDTFIITGDIHATWLRDATNQVMPYIPFAKNDTRLRQLLCGLINRQAMDITIDPYANAFNFGSSGGHQSDIRKPAMSPHVFEGKYELDSLCAAMKLAWHYYEKTGDVNCFKSRDNRWLKSIRAILDTIKAQQAATREEENPPYLFARETTVATDTLQLQMRGPPAKGIGLSKSLFRPSDDATSLPFHIPSNAMAVVELRHVAQLLETPGPTFDAALAGEARSLADQIAAAIAEYGIIQKTRHHDTIYAYEVDGFGSALLMDDANIPSLLSLPYLGFLSKTDPVYRATRAFVWSDRNPYFFRGRAGEGIGGPHIGIGWIWPMSLSMRGITSDNDQEILSCLAQLQNSARGFGFMHESFWMDDPKRYTRAWFAWANSLFGEFILRLASERPHLIF